MSTTKIVSRGYVVVYTVPGGMQKVTAVVSGPRAQELKARVGGTIVNAKGERYHVAQGTLRVVTAPAGCIAAARAAR